MRDRQISVSEACAVLARRRRDVISPEKRRAMASHAGKARAAKLSPERRREISLLGVVARKRKAADRASKRHEAPVVVAVENTDT